MDERWLAIINPHAGGDRGLRHWDRIERLLMEEGVETVPLFTGYRMHAAEICKRAVGEGWRRILAVGGDGTLNEVVNGLFSQPKVSPCDVTVGLFQVGTGNDWARTMEYPSSYEEMARCLARKETFLQDVGVVVSEKEKKKERVFVNVAGFGFDAWVAEKTNRAKDKGKGGRLSYLSNMLKGLAAYKASRVTLSLEDSVRDVDLFSLGVGIGKYNGGGIKQLPQAVMDDGLFDIVLYKKMSLWQMFSSLKQLYQGGLEHHPKVEYHKTDRVMIREADNLFCECDGESVGYGPFAIRMVPKALRIVKACAKGGE
ncbi:MAG TPA: diacylglycerol kinase family lipid kinase [Candidatus Mcinerneyibacteriales bacterium]|nr:diacylglycerol kinase family lipid kinase [Candidatus Mcinerneyibacteriales bacterium]